MRDKIYGDMSTDKMSFVTIMNQDHRCKNSVILNKNGGIAKISQIIYHFGFPPLDLESWMKSLGG